MKLLDRYILGKFLRIFFLCYVSLVGIFVVFDLTSNMNNFLATNTPSQLVVQIAAYYFMHSFQFVDLIFPLLLALAALTVLSLFIRYNETIAMLAIGISPARMVAPIIFGALGLSILFALVREEYLPNRLFELAKEPKEYVQRSDVAAVCRTFDNKTQISIYGDELIVSQGTLTRPRITLGRNLAQYGKKIVAQKGTYLPEDKNHPEGWLLEGVESPKELLTRPSLQDERLGQIVVYSPSDSDWLQPKETFVATKLKPINLALGDKWLLYAATSDMRQALKDPTFAKNTTELAIRVHTREIRPLSDLLPLFLALPFMLMRASKNVVVALGIGLILSGAFIGSQYVAAYVGKKANYAPIGIWAPFFIFVPFACAKFSLLMQKEY